MAGVPVTRNDRNEVYWQALEIARQDLKDIQAEKDLLWTEKEKLSRAKKVLALNKVVDGLEFVLWKEGE